MNYNELTRRDIDIEPENIEVYFDDPHVINFYIQTWFDVDKKFGINILDEDDTWLDMYGKYNPYSGSFHIDCFIERPDESEHFKYEPTENETKMIIDYLEEMIKTRFNQTPKEFCEEGLEEDLEMGGI